MNAIELLKKDHQKVAVLFKQYESAGEDASSRKEELFRRIKQELDIHARIEEEIFYPAVKQVPVEEARELVAEAAEEHNQVKTLLAELDGMGAEDERFDAKMKVLKEDVEHHVEEEENEMFPKVRKGLGSDRLEDLGRQLEYRRQSLAAAGSVEDEDEDEDENDEATEETGAEWQAGSRTQGSGSSSGSRGGSRMASRGGSSSDSRDDAISGSMGASSSDSRDDATSGSGGGSRSGSIGGSKSGSMGGGSGSASRSRSSSGGRSRGASRAGSRSRSNSGSRSRSRVGSRSRSRSGGSRRSRGRSR
jgi:hemerythrin superfamily protein